MVPMLQRVFLTTDALSDNFESFLKKDPKGIAAIKQALARRSEV